MEDHPYRNAFAALEARARAAEAEATSMRADLRAAEEGRRAADLRAEELEGRLSRGGRRRGSGRVPFIVLAIILALCSYLLALLIRERGEHVRRVVELSAPLRVAEFVIERREVPAATTFSAYDRGDPGWHTYSVLYEPALGGFRFLVDGKQPPVVIADPDGLQKPLGWRWKAAEANWLAGEK